MIRQRLLDEPDLFFKGQRQAESDPKGAPRRAPGTELLRDLEMVAAIVNRATRRLAGATAGMNGSHLENARRQIERIQNQLNPMDGRIQREQATMLNQAQRTTILELSAQGVSQHEIARVLGISRLTVRKIVRSNSTELKEIPRAEKAEPHRPQILELLNVCKGNLVRVHEELMAGGAARSYPALAAFCQQGIGQTPIVAAGQYHSEPGE